MELKKSKYLYAWYTKKLNNVKVRTNNKIKIVRRTQCAGFVMFWYGSGSAPMNYGSASCYFFLWISVCQPKIFLCLLLTQVTFTLFKDNKLFRSPKTVKIEVVLNQIFTCCWEDPTKKYPDSWRFATDTDPRIRTNKLRIRILLFSSVDFRMSTKNTSLLITYPSYIYIIKR